MQVHIKYTSITNKLDFRRQSSDFRISICLKEIILSGKIYVSFISTSENVPDIFNKTMVIHLKFNFWNHSWYNSTMKHIKPKN